MKGGSSLLSRRRCLDIGYRRSIVVSDECKNTGKQKRIQDHIGVK
jgi:hypothetical protein